MASQPNDRGDNIHHLSARQTLASPLVLPCGVVLKNRLAKSAMSDSLGDGCGDPTDQQMRLYEKWAQAGVGLSVIGEVQVTPEYPEKPGNLVLSAQSNQAGLKELTHRATIDDSHLWAQLGHAGALAHRPISSPKGPSALDIPGLQCAQLSCAEIEALPQKYASAARLAKQTGFSGVLIHAGHGFLLQQFLSPLFNHRDDAFGGSVEARFYIVKQVIAAIRAAVGPSYPLGIRINSTDQLEGGITEVEGLAVVKLLDKTSIDLIDISGGTYFPGAPASSEAHTQQGPYFVDFARRAKALTKIPIMLTGGFKKRQQAVDAINSKAADIVSLGRAMIVDPQLAEHWLTASIEQAADRALKFPVFEAPPTGAITAWYTLKLVALGEDKEQEFELTLTDALTLYEARDAQKCQLWRAKFAISEEL